MARHGAGAAGPGRPVHVIQGEAIVSADPEQMLTTVLGSCVSACVRDPVARIGGMNHFLLPDDGGSEGGCSSRFGANAMELLINRILQRGGSRHRLEAKLFGGANVVPALSNVGARNIGFAKRYLQTEGIPLVGGNVGGAAPRRVRYWPATGRALQMLVRQDAERVAQTELDQLSTAQDRGGNDVEFF